MGLTYDGITYRSLEEQARYDAEQVQLLKQADVTINENLQTVNTELNGKLTKPANPSAESAVTMLADGTVGTKLLSEIGGGGGKLYRHKICLNWSDSGYNYEIYFTIFSSVGKSLTKDDLYQNLKYHDYVFVNETDDIEETYYIGDIHMDFKNTIRIDCIIVHGGVKTKELIISTVDVTITDTYTEL